MASLTFHGSTRQVTGSCYLLETAHSRVLIHTLGGFSAHAGQSDLVKWAGHFQPRPQMYLVHGELDKMQALQARIDAVHGWGGADPD